MKNLKITARQVTLVDQVEEKLLDFFKKNDLQPGDTIPKEQELAEALGVARSVLREALSRLRMLGMVESRTRRGMIITEPPLLNGFSKVIDPRLLSTETIKNLLGMRLALEVGITDFIFRNITDQDIEELRHIVDRHEALGVHNLSIEDELMFHQKIYSIAGNKFIMQFQELIYPIFIFCKQNYENYIKPINLKLLEENKIVRHSDLFEFLKLRDKEGYRNGIRMHLQTYWEFMYNYE